MKKRTYPRPCTKCGEVLGEEGFYVKYKRDGSRFSDCIKCRLESSKIKNARDNRICAEFQEIKRRWNAFSKSRLHNIEKSKQRQREYDKSRRGKDSMTDEERTHRLEVQTRYRKSHKEQLRIKGREYYENNKNIFIANLAIRRSRLADSEGSFTPQEWSWLKLSCGYRCLACGRSEPYVKLTPDHVRPISRGGSNDISNIQPLCLSCNASKNAKWIDYRPLQTNSVIPA